MDQPVVAPASVITFPPLSVPLQPGGAFVRLQLSWLPWLLDLLAMPRGSTDKLTDLCHLAPVVRRVE